MDNKNTLLNELKKLIELKDEKSSDKVIELLEDQHDLYSLLYPHGENLLHWTLAYNNVKITEYLLKDREFHPNTENYRGTTPLYYGCMNESEQAVSLLLQYHGQPRIRSGFSGKFPIDILPKLNVTLREKLKTQAPQNHYKSYRYRLYMYWRMNLNHFIAKNNSIAQDTTIEPQAEDLFKTKGINKLAEKCNNLLSFYTNTKNEKDIYKEKTSCLYCNKTKEENNNKLYRCSKCHSVFYCDRKCQASAHLLHKFDCPELTVDKIFT